MYNLTAKYCILELYDCEMKNFITEFNIQMIVFCNIKEINLSYVKVGAIKLVANRLMDYKMRNFCTLSVRLYHI